MGWKILILTLNGNTENQGIGLLDVLWKVIESIIDTCINKALTLHEIIHEFQSGRGTGTSSVDINLTQELESVDQDPLLLVFLDLRKVHEKLD